MRAAACSWDPCRLWDRCTGKGNRGGGLLPGSRSRCRVRSRSVAPNLDSPQADAVIIQHGY